MTGGMTEIRVGPIDLDQRSPLSRSTKLRIVNFAPNLLHRTQEGCPMSLIDNGEHWRARANESRITADCMFDPGCRHILLGIAADYGRLADRIETQDLRGLHPPTIHAALRPAPRVHPQAA
jgi:hypothetical protein